MQTLNQLTRLLSKSNAHQWKLTLRFLWGRSLKPGEVSPGVMAKDVAVARNAFKDIPDADKETFLSIVDNAKKHYFIKRQKYIEFITAAMPYMKEFGVHKDIEAYKALMNVFPKDGRYRSVNMLQAGFHYYVLQQRCAVELLDEMEYQRVMPDLEMESIVVETFGKYSQVYRKLLRSHYWMSKFKNKDPFPLPEDDLPLDALQLAVLAMKRMCVDVQTKLDLFSTAQVKDSIDKTWIVSAQSPSQRQIIKELSDKESIYVEGPFRVWLRNLSLSFFQLRADSNSNEILREPDEDENNDVSRIPLNLFGGMSKEQSLAPQKNLHIQEDGKFLALCVTGTSSRDSLLSWIRLLQLSNENLKNLQVVFTLRSTTTQVQSINEFLKDDTGKSSK